MAKTPRLTTLKPAMGSLNTSRVPTLQPNRQLRADRGRPWQRRREGVLRRANFLCQCKDCAAAGRVRLATEVDHIVPRWKWLHEHGTLDDGCEADSNLQALHVECHRKKTDAEEQERRALGL
jgi:5-methylcytosine-specific restriction protein A